MPHPPDGSPPGLRDLDFDPAEAFERDPHVLLDPRLLCSWLARMTEDLGPARAAVAVAQMGVLHGLRDAARAIEWAGASRSETSSPLHTPLRIRCWERAGSDGERVVHGEWPDRAEAAARLAASGPVPAGSCQLSVGYTSGWLSGLADRVLVAMESQCGVDGHPSCGFVAREAAAWRQVGTRRQIALVEALRIPELRALVRERISSGAAARPERETSYAVDRDAPAIHIWGPVMVIPWAGPDEALCALELIGRDPAAGEVSVVVVDLDGAIVDEAHGALALEHVVHSIEAWGAEAIFADASPLSARIVERLDHPPLLVVKSLDEAIATAFRVAESQRQAL